MKIWSFNSVRELFFLHPKMKRTIMLLVWIPGVWKSTWIRENKLTDITLSTDEMRKQLAWIYLNKDGNFQISNNFDKFLFSTLEWILSKRCFSEIPTIIDATNCKASNVDRFVDIAKKYNFNVVLNVFEVDKTTALNQNNKRNEKVEEKHKFVKENIIDSMYESFLSFKDNNFNNLPYVTTKSKLVNDSIVYETNYANYLWEASLKELYPYRKFNCPTFVFWDIHGVKNIVKKVKEIVEKPENSKHLFVFTWDLVDKWTDSVEMMRLVLKWKKENKNMVILRGNHERYLDYILTDFNKEKKSVLKLKEEFEEKNFTRQELEEFINLLQDFLVLENKVDRYIFTHGWISNELLVDKEFILKNQFSPKEYNSWSWEYWEIDIVEESFEKILSNKNTYQIHGHRNYNFWTYLKNNSYNLEQWVTYWGHFAYLLLTLKNKPLYLTQPSAFNLNWDDELNKVKTDADLVRLVKQSPLIQVKHLWNWIESINFIKEAFTDSLWNNQSTKARWLFVYSDDDTVLARSYDKFFNVDEFDTVEDIIKKVEYPVRMFNKENWFLWIVWYNKKTNSVEYFSKSSNKWDFAWYVKDFIKPYEKQLLPLLKEWYTAVFEIVDQERNPHIIKYKYSASYILDIFKNTILTTEKKSFQELENFHAEVLKQMEKTPVKYPMLIKRLLFECNNEQELRHAISEIASLKTEWVVLEDNKNQMWKFKSLDYLFWKKFRSSILRIFQNIISNYSNYKNNNEKSQFSLLSEIKIWMKEILSDNLFTETYKLPNFDSFKKQILDNYNNTFKMFFEFVKKDFNIEDINKNKDKFLESWLNLTNKMFEMSVNEISELEIINYS